MQKKVSFRSNRLAREIKRVLAEFLLVGSSEYGDVDPKKILITDVIVSPDLRYARVFIAHLGEDVDNSRCIDFLEHHRRLLRHHLGMEIQMRYIPDLFFSEDKSKEYAANIDHLLKIASARTSKFI